MDFSRLGWLELTTDALRKMESELAAEGEGVVDELGVLALHSGYAERFFPGTSVVHTRPRYLFFVAWNYLTLAREQVSRAAFAKRKLELELWLTGCLVRPPNQDGIMGGRSYRSHRRPPAQPPDLNYWNALKRYGFVNAQADRRDLARRWDPRQVAHHRELRESSEDDSFDQDWQAIFRCPAPPSRWGRSTRRISFELSREEALFLQQALVELDPACLLAESARLAGRRRARAGALWDDPMILEAAHACGEFDRIERAQKVSALAELMRAIYGAQVEKLARMQRGAEPETEYDGILRACCEDEEDQQRIAELELDAVFVDIPAVPKRLQAAIQHVQARVREHRTVNARVRALLDETTEEICCRLELGRKGARRARLPRTERGRELRSAFDEKTVRVYPLDYRWPQVKTMLVDLFEGLKS